MSDLVLLLALFPFGLSSGGISISCALFVIKNYKYIINLTNKKFEYSVCLYLILYPIFLSFTNKFYLHLNIDLYQLLRKIAPLTLGFLIYFTLINNHKITEVFKENINNIILLLLFIVITSILTKTELYSHQLKTSDYRFFIYSGYFFILVTLADFNNKYLYLLKIIPIITFQKIIYVYYLIEFFVKNVYSGSKNIIILLLLSLSTYYTLPRIIHLFKVGDNSRLKEINNALPNITDSFTHLIFGHGIGFKYQIIIIPIQESYTKQIINSQYDIHNLYLDLLFKNGLIYTLIFILFIYYLCQKIENKKNAGLAFLLFCISGVSAPTLSSSVEIIGFLSGLAFLRVQNAAKYN